MEDTSLFDQFHAAFHDTPPRGAFERLQSDLVRHSADRSRRTRAISLRWSRLSIRVAAAVAVVVIVIALVAGYLAVQRSSIGGLPAGGGSSLADYQAMVGRNHDAFGNNSGGFFGRVADCNTVSNPKCPDELTALLTATHKWQSDLDEVSAPDRFAVIDHQMRAHLTAFSREVNQALSATASRDEASLDNALGDAYFHHMIWLDVVGRAIEVASPITDANYVALAGTESDILDRVFGKGQDNFTLDCFGEQAALCLSWLNGWAVGMAEAQAEVTQNIPSSALAVYDSNLQSDLAVADQAIIDMYNAEMKGDAVAFNTARDTFVSAVTTSLGDLTAITGSYGN